MQKQNVSSPIGINLHVLTPENKGKCFEILSIGGARLSNNNILIFNTHTS
jgi:hypothetical protein